MIPDRLSAREQLLVRLYTTQPFHGDAAIVLAGEDTQPRLDVTVQLFRMGYVRHALVTGKARDEPGHQGADALTAQLVSQGVSPSHIITDPTAANTYEQAHIALATAKEEAWTRLLVVASAYHLPRAFLTFVRAMEHHGEMAIRLIPVSAGAPWDACPDGLTRTRSALLAEEFVKVRKYRQMLDHVTSYTKGLAYLTAWEMPPETTELAS